MEELREVIDEMKDYGTQQSAAVAGEAQSLSDCASTFTYRLDLLSMTLVSVNMSEVFVESVLGVLGSGIPIGTLRLNIFPSFPREAGRDVSREGR